MNESLHAFPPEWHALLHQVPVVPLDAGQPVVALRDALLAWDQSLRAERKFDACRAGLWLAFNFLDESHTISQDLDTPTGSYWHALMHRREGDFSNAKYWFHRVGKHPVAELLQPEAEQLGWARWNHDAFVDLCQANINPGRPRHAECCEIQFREWQRLFTWCATHV